MSMYFYDDTDDWPEYQIIKDDIRHLEKEHVKIRKELQEADSSFRSDPSDAALKAKVHGLKEKMKEIEKKLDGSLSLYR
jgi:predicted  nucleic acid-binding Zn-ribbon protein